MVNNLQAKFYQRFVFYGADIKVISLLLCTAIYSGDYKWFETESEEELESESPTGSPSRDRSPSPNEPEEDRAETKETGDKGMLFSL